jgi:replication factor C subunit 1
MAHPSSAPALWADKYKPRTLREMVGNGTAVNLKSWLERFEAGLRMAESDKNSGFKRACLLSGPPGIGKTTSAHLAALEAGYAVVEFNASDHRSTKSLQAALGGVTDNRSLASVGFGAPKNALNVPTRGRFLILMDEVDGCDRGGVAEVMALIKATKVPILCTCNDRWHQKLRSLVNHCEDMKFARPRFDMIAKWIKDRVLTPEGCTVPELMLGDVIKLENNDIRSVLNNLQLWCMANRHLTERDLSKAARTGTKNMDIGLFSAPETFLMKHEPRKTFEELQSAFYGGDLVDLFVFENYSHFSPDRGDWLAAVAKGAASISASDVVGASIFATQNWSMSSHQMLLSSVLPCALVRGHYNSFVTGPAAWHDKSRPIKFPTWLGNNSTTGKNKRLMAYVTKQGAHSAAGFSGTSQDVALDYVGVVAAAVTKPLADAGKDGIAAVVEVMDHYKLTRDDWEFVQEVGQYKKMKAASTFRPLGGAVMATAVKSAFTREFNKGHKMANAAGAALRSKGGGGHDAQGLSATGREDDEEGSDGDDAPVKKKARVDLGAVKPKPKAAAKPRAKRAPAAKKGKAAAIDVDDD